MLKKWCKDIATHKFFDDFNWRDFIYRKMKAPYLPKVKNRSDTSNFVSYPDSEKECDSVDRNNDPFLDW